jgi:hypothetical protein
MNSDDLALVSCSATLGEMALLESLVSGPIAPKLPAQKQAGLPSLLPIANLNRVGAIDERRVDGKISAPPAARSTREPDALVDTTRLHDVERVPRTATGKQRNRKLSAISAPGRADKLHGVIRAAIAIEVARHPFWTLPGRELGA